MNLRLRFWLTAGAFVLIIVLIARSRRPDPCRLSWRIGDVDPRFNVDAAQVRSAAESAADLWNAAAQRELLHYDASDGVPINLTFDERQAALDADRAQRQQIDDLAAQIQQMKAAFPGNPSQEAADRINRAVDQHNALVIEYNQNRGTSVEQGTFEKVTRTRGRHVVGERKTISIFQFRDITDLELVIAHEFGHALGIEHVAGPGAIMSESHTFSDVATPVQMQAADAQALQQQCPARR